MGRGSTKGNENVYFVARKRAAMYNERLYSREGAAELLGISVSTLADYELGNTKVVPVDKVVLMADLYNAPELKTGYCKHECPICSYLPVATEAKVGYIQLPQWSDPEYVRHHDQCFIQLAESHFGRLGSQ